MLFWTNQRALQQNNKRTHGNALKKGSKPKILTKRQRPQYITIIKMTCQFDSCFFCLFLL